MTSWPCILLIRIDCFILIEQYCEEKKCFPLCCKCHSESPLRVPELDTWHEGKSRKKKDTKVDCKSKSFWVFWFIITIVINNSRFWQIVACLEFYRSAKFSCSQFENLFPVFQNTLYYEDLHPVDRFDFLICFSPLSANPTKWSNTLK